ncbi:hypothetical protein F4780DRAFT_793518 [Xylariomycetidae sp. FL0641]|nr:hypothetical protein F4780DRAFT_793518 [Xylariomycetidae sp. FL0641]
MVLFVDLDEEEPPQEQQAYHPYISNPEWHGGKAGQPVPAALPNGTPTNGKTGGDRENPNRGNGMTEALGCYPIVMAIASSLDLNTLDNLSRTCRQAHDALLQYRNPLLSHTLHCANEDVPVDPESTFRYRARAGNWYYMEDVSRTAGGDYNGKSGSCARDMVAECRRCKKVVCRNCAIKPPAPAVFRDRHRRLCNPCVKAPLGLLAKPPLRPDTPFGAEELRRAMCTCESEGVWLCQPCGRSIRGADQEYKAIWRWRNKYGEELGNLGTGIGEGDRGVICGRAGECHGAKEREQETDCDAADARQEAALSTSASSTSSSPWATPSPNATSTSPPLLGGILADADRRTPSPSQLRPGYARHEIEGIGGRVKTKLVRMLRVGACVPEWEDEKDSGQILGRELAGRRRSYCGWCWRVIPSAKDREEGREKDIPERKRA